MLLISGHAFCIRSGDVARAPLFAGNFSVVEFLSATDDGAEVLSRVDPTVYEIFGARLRASPDFRKVFAPLGNKRAFFPKASEFLRQ